MPKGASFVGLSSRWLGNSLSSGENYRHRTMSCRHYEETGGWRHLSWEVRGSEAKQLVGEGIPDLEDGLDLEEVVPL